MQSSSNNFRSPAALARFLLVMAAGLGLDLWSKAQAVRALGSIDAWMPHTSRVYALFDSIGLHLPPVWVPHLRPNAPSKAYELIPGWLHFELTMNEGAVFGMGAGRTLLFVAVSLAAIVFLFHLFARSGRQWFYQIILGMLLAGVLGNMYDRVQYDYVRDMIHALPQWPKLFPWIFNVADVLLCTGVGLMVLHSFVPQPKPAEQAAASK
jgi:lipoprotein signal peptidase